LEVFGEIASSGKFSRPSAPDSPLFADPRKGVGTNFGSTCFGRQRVERPEIYPDPGRQVNGYAPEFFWTKVVTPRASNDQQLFLNLVVLIRRRI
jgi:hypothetical protein